MKRRTYYSHGFSPPLIILAVMAVVLPECLSSIQASASHNHCKPVGEVQQGFSLTVSDKNLRQFLSSSKSIEDCIKLACKAGEGNYAVFDSGKCYALHCKKNACKISQDAKSKQKFVGIARHDKKHGKSHTTNANKSKKKDGRHKLSTSNVGKTEKHLRPVSKASSNWTLAFSTFVPPVNKTNPTIANKVDSKATAVKHEKLATTKYSSKEPKQTSKSRHKYHARKSKKRTSKKSKKAHPKLHRKHTKRRPDLVPKTKHAPLSKHHSRNLNITGRFTRDYPYSYPQYQYASPDSSYSTQETDWRRNMVPSPDDSYANYDSIDRESLSRSQLEQSPISDRSKISQNSELLSPVSYTNSGNDNGQLFSLPIANLVRRTDIPQGSHHVSSISIVNDMLSDNTAKAQDNSARDTIPADVLPQSVGVYGDDSAIVPEAMGVSGYKVKSAISRPVQATQQQVGVLADSTGAVLSLPERQQTGLLSGSYAPESQADASQQGLSALSAYKDRIAGSQYADPSNVMDSQGIPLADMTISDQRVKNENIELSPTADPITRPPQKQNLFIVGIANHTAAAPSIAKEMLAPAVGVAGNTKAGDIKVPADAPSLAAVPQGAAATGAGVAQTGAAADQFVAAVPQPVRAVAPLVAAGAPNGVVAALPIAAPLQPGAAVAPNTATLPAEPELLDPDSDHVPISKGMYNNYMKKIANLTTLANVLPAKEIASIAEEGPNPDNMHSTSISASASSSVNPSSSPVENAATSLLAILGKVAASNSAKDSSTEFNPLDSLLSSSSSLANNLAPSKSESTSPQVVSTGILNVKPQQNEIDAPLQNNIIPFGQSKEINSGQPVDNHVATGAPDKGRSGVKNSPVAPVDLPFPTRLVLPAPSQSLKRPLSGSSTIFSAGSKTDDNDNIHDIPDKLVVLTAPTPLFLQHVTSTSSTATGLLVAQPTFSADLNIRYSIHPANSQTHDTQLTVRPLTSGHDKQSNDPLNVESPSLPAQMVTQPTEQIVGPTDIPDVSTNIPMTEEPTQRTTAKPDLAKSNNLGHDHANNDLAAKSSAQHITFKQNSVKIQKAMVVAQTVQPKTQDLVVHEDNTQNTEPKLQNENIKPSSQNTNTHQGEGGTLLPKIHDSLTFIDKTQKIKPKLKNAKLQLQNTIPHNVLENIQQSPQSMPTAQDETSQPNLQNAVPQNTNTKVTATGNTKPLHTGGHIISGSLSVQNDDSMKHVRPLPAPKLKLASNGSVVVLSNDTNKGVSDVFGRYYLNAKIQADLRSKQLALLKSGNGCSEPLGVSTGAIRNAQLSASSSLSPLFAPARARLGLQSSVDGNAGGWCADPSKNEHLQFLQVDFRGIQDVCRVALQGLYNARNWVTYYQIAFSTNGIHWSVYKEGGKDKVLQGNVEQDDWTSYRLLEPIRARFVRIIPQAWEGKAICMRTELYGENTGADMAVYGRSNIPTSLQGMIDHLTFEKIDDVLVFDSSSMGNNAFLNQGAAVYDTHGKCRHSARIVEGSDILLDGRNMRVKPRDAISVSVWVRVEKTEGVHSIFDTVGAHSNHVLGQYHFEIVGGAVRWFHRDENGTQIFSALTEPNLINPREWTHLVATYEASTGDTKIFINGSRVVVSKGKGLLSQDWAGRVGIGRHKDTRDLLGDVDEFRIYNEVIQGEQIMELSRECDFDKYYCGSILTAERGILITPDYPSIHRGPVKCMWEIKGLPGEIIALDVTEFDLKNCSRSQLIVRDAVNDTLIGTYCGDSKPGRIESHGSQMSVEFTSDGFGDGERFMVQFHREKKLASKKTMSSICKNSDVYPNVTLVGGSKAGTYSDLGRIDDMKTCQQKCCEKETCEIAFMIDGNCYAVRCYDQELCKIRKAKSSSLSPMLSFISREGIPTRIQPMFVDNKPSPATNPANQPVSSATKPQESAANTGIRKCKSSLLHHNATLIRGMKSGNFTSRGVVENFDKCFGLCCQSDNCDAAFMVKRTCFSVQCYSKDSCGYKAARPSSFDPTLAYVIREQSKAIAMPLEDSQNSIKSSVTLSGACSKSRVSKIYRNITLRDGVNAGEFTDRGNVKDMDGCLKHCCSDENCNLAFVIKETCFTVKCKNYQACSLKSAISKYYNPRIAYVNWSPPKENLGEGDVRYDYKGCWRDFDMSAFALPLLEGTDPLLTGPYKKRLDPVNDCATVSQNRGFSVFAIQNGGACFSGHSSEASYKRYGSSDACKGGRGGAFANSVYKLFEDGSVMSLGCWADLQDRAFRRLEKIDPSLQDSYINRANPVDVCAKVAKSHNTNTFALQKGGQCFIGKGDKPSYERYGPSRKCKYGLGGQMANDVYYVKDVGSPANKAVENDAASHNASPVKPTLRNTTAEENAVSASVSNAVETTVATPPTTPTTTPTTATTKPVATNQTIPEVQTTATTSTTPATTPTTPTTTPTTPTTPTTTPTTPITRTTPTNLTTPTTTPTTPLTRTTPATTTSSAISKSDKASPITDTGDLKPGEIIYKEELTDTEHMKFIYQAEAVSPNVTIASGINAGTFTDKGVMENMEDCIRSCGETNNCDLAFKLGKQCFGVACFSKDSCSTKPAFSAFYNPLIAFVKHRTIKTLRQKEEAQIDSNPTQRSLCKAKNNVENVTLVDGIGAGNFTDLGHVSNMDDCISRCCGDSACELAFKIEDDCYGVTCYSERSCRTRAARNAMILRPKIAFVREVGSRKVLDSKAVTKSPKHTPKPIKTKQSTCSPDVWEGDIQENVTLVGGVNAGDFTDHGQTETFGDCMSLCCDSKDCDLAFMIDNDCYAVKCKDANNCKTRSARPTKYRPMIGFKKSVETGNSLLKSLAVRLGQTSKTSLTTSYNNNLNLFAVTSPEVAPGTRRYHKTAKGNGKNDGVETEQVPVLSISSSMFKDRKPVEDTSKNVDGNGFAARAYYSPLTASTTNKLTNVTTTAKPPVTIIPRPPKGTTPALSSTSVKSTYAATPTYGDPSSKHSCEAGSIIYNATLKMGMHSGLFTKLGRVSKMDDCIERCCKSSNADVAFMLGSVCFAVKCYTPELCKTAPAMISNIGNLNMNPTLSFLKKKVATMASGNDIDVIIDEISDKIDEPEINQLTAYSGLFKSLENISTVWEVHERTRPIPRMPAILAPGATCNESPITYNVTLKGGIHAGNFTNQGEGLSPRECIGKCCDQRSCDLAFMFADLCYSVHCKSDDDCQSVVAKPSSLSPKVAYVNRNKIPTDRETMFDVSIDTDEEQVCDDANLQYSPIQSNRTLIGGLNAGNFSYLGKTRTMRECLGKCCSSRKCDVAYRIDRECFSVKCFSPDLCKVSDVPAKNGFVQFATMSKKNLRRINTQSIAIYVMIGVLCFTIGITGIGWAMCILLKRRRQRNHQQQTETSHPMPDR